MENLKLAKECIISSSKIMFFTGAGISAASKIPTFRDDDGIWKKYNKMWWSTSTTLYLQYNFRYKRFRNFVLDILSPIINAVPNAAHFAIFEASKKREILIITQNVDNLHQISGSENVLELHGNIFEIRNGKSPIKTLSQQTMRTILENIRLTNNKREFEDSIKEIFNIALDIRPNIVLFGEEINSDNYKYAKQFMAGCDCLIIVGTSLNVFPAASIVTNALKSNLKIINIGYEEFKGVINIIGDSSIILPDLLDI